MQSGVTSKGQGQGPANAAIFRRKDSNLILPDRHKRKKKGGHETEMIILRR